MSRLSERFGKEFLVTSEISLPRGPQIEGFMAEVAEYKKIMHRLHAVNVVDNPGSMLRIGSLPASIMLKQNGLEPIYQVTGRDRNRLGIQADLIGAAAFGLDNLLALTGDPPDCESSDDPKARGVFDLNSITIIKAAKSMNQGLDYAGRKLNAPTNFFIGAALAPGSRTPEAEINKAEKKIEAGAEFFQTQVVFDPETIDVFLESYEEKTGRDIRKKVLVGVLPLYSHGILKFLRKIPGIFISEEVERRIKNSPDPFMEGVSISAEVLDYAKENGLAGVHIMPAGKFGGLVRMLELL